jgi:hypothetical protein
LEFFGGVLALVLIFNVVLCLDERMKIEMQLVATKDTEKFTSRTEKFDRTLLAALTALFVWLIASYLVVDFNSGIMTWALLTSIYLQALSHANWRYWLAASLLALPFLLFRGIYFAPLGLAVGCTVICTYRVVYGSLNRFCMMPLAIMLFMYSYGFTQIIVRRLGGYPIDNGLLAFDNRWFSGISIRIWHFAQMNYSIGRFFDFIYLFLSCAAVIVMVDLNRIERIRICFILFLAGLCAVPFYILFPAVGPTHIGEPFAMRNCIPSMHVAWAILLWRAALPGWKRKAMALFVPLTAISTLTTGEHYLIDIIVAIPYAAFWSLWINRPNKVILHHVDRT